MLPFLMAGIDEVRLDPLRVMAAIETAFRDRYNAVTIPQRIHLNTKTGVILLMPCYDRERNSLGMKLVTVHDDPACAPHRVQSSYFVFDPDTSSLKLTIPANQLTEGRTAATSALVTRYLAREDAHTLGVFGTGRQARAHIEVMPLVRPFRRILVRGRDEGTSVEFANEISRDSSVAVAAADVRTLVAESDVICACTTSQTPLFDGRLLNPGTHLNVVGAFQPHAREVDTATVCRSSVVVDTYEGALAEAGDLLIPLNEGQISRDHILADLHELVSGKRFARRTATEITLFKSVGCALEDLATAELLLGA